jgi:O-antigen/teichoic acid export membrane protein
MRSFGAGLSHHRALAGGVMARTINQFNQFFSRHRVNLAFADQALFSGGNFVGGILLAHLMTLEEFGRLTLTWLAVEFLASLQFAGIIQPMFNVGPKQPDGQTASYYGAVTLQQALLGAGLGALVWLGMRELHQLFGIERLAGLAAPLGAAVTAAQYQNYARRYFFARGRPLAAFCNDLIRFSVQIGAMLALLLVGTERIESNTALWIIAGGTALGALHGALLSDRLAWDPAVFKTVVRRHWHFSRWLFPSTAMYWISSQAFIVVASLVLGAASVGALRAAQTLLGITHVVLLALENFAPMSAARHLHVEGRRGLEKFLRDLAILTAALMIASIAVLNIDPDFIIGTLFGDQYRGLGYIVRWLSGVYFVYGMSTVLTTWAAAVESTDTIFISYAAATAVTAVLVYPLTRYGGMTGALFGALLVELVRIGFLLMRLLRIRRIAISSTAAPVQPGRQRRLAPAISSGLGRLRALFPVRTKNGKRGAGVPSSRMRAQGYFRFLFLLLPKV